MYQINDPVEWKWMGRSIKGVVKEIFFEPVTKTIKGKPITRKGSPEKPAYLVESEAGNEALKLESELQAPKSENTPRWPRPKMFGP